MNWDLLIRGNSVTQTLAVSFRSILICINDFGNLTMKVCDDLTFSSKLLQSFTFCKSLIVVYLQERSILHLPTPCQTLIWDVIATEAVLSRKKTRRVPSENSFYLHLSKWASFTWISSLVHSLWQSYKTNDSCLRLWISHEVILGSMSLRTKHAIFKLSSFPSHTNSKTYIFLIMPAWAWTTDRLSI